MSDEMTEEKVHELMDSLSEQMKELIGDENIGIVLSVFGRIIGESACDPVDVTRRCNAVGEMAMIVWMEANAPTEH